MNGVSHMLPFVIGGGILIALAFLLDDLSLGYAHFGSNTPVSAWRRAMGQAALSFMLPILAGFTAVSIADRPGLMVGFVGGALAASGSTFAAPEGSGVEMCIRDRFSSSLPPWLRSGLRQAVRRPLIFCPPCGLLPAYR